MEENQTQQMPTTHPFWQHFSPRTLVLIFVLLVITGGLLYVALQQEQPSPVASTVPTSTPNPSHTTLSLQEETASSAATGTTDILINSSSNKVTAVQLNLAYDPQILSHVVVKPGTFFASPTILYNIVDQPNGRISYVIAISPSGKEASGSGTVATISYTMSPTAASFTKISFLPKTEVTQQGILGTVLKSTTDLTIPIPLSLRLATPAASSAAK